MAGVPEGASVLVTGAFGLVAGRTMGALRDRFALRGLDLTGGDSAGVPVSAVDLTDYGAVRDAVDGHEAVVHLAIASARAMPGLDEHAYAAAEVSANVLGTRNVLAAAADCPTVRRVVLFSSLTIHLGAPERDAFPADAPHRFKDHYAVTKIYGEHLAWLYANQHKFTAVCWRLGQPYPVEHFTLEDMAKPDWRAIAVTSGDMARGIAAGLTADLNAVPCPEPRPTGDFARTGGVLQPIREHAVANLVSDHDTKPDHTYDLSVAASLGYTPGDRFTADGPVPVAAAASPA